MEFSWTTFVLEIINFLVLVWILTHFLFKPVTDVVARRQAGIDKQLAESERLNEQSQALKDEYENRLADWEHECQQARASLNKELEAERTSRLNVLMQAIEQEKEKVQVAEARQRNEAIREIEHRALQQSAKFATALLNKASGPELESRLIAILLDELSSLSNDSVNALRRQWGESPEAITVTSAYPVASCERQQLEKALAGVSQLSLPVHYSEDPGLIAGLSITIGAWRLHANIRDDLKGFVEFAHVSR